MSIMERNVSLDEKADRIAQLDSESTTANDKCDYLVNNTDIHETAEKIIKIFR